MIDAIANQLSGMPREGVIALLVLVSLQVVLQIVALIDLARRDAVRGGKKWVWAIVIIAGSVLGTVVYLAIGRTPDDAEPAHDDTADDVRPSSRDAIDRLYGSGSGEEKR